MPEELCLQCGNPVSSDESVCPYCGGYEREVATKSPIRSIDVGHANMTSTEAKRVVQDQVDTLIALGGGVFSGFMALIFGTIQIDIEPFFESWILPCGAVGAVIIASWLVEDGLVNEGTSNNAWIVTPDGKLPRAREPGALPDLVIVPDLHLDPNGPPPDEFGPLADWLRAVVEEPGVEEEAGLLPQGALQVEAEGLDVHELPRLAPGGRELEVQRAQEGRADFPSDPVRRVARRHGGVKRLDGSGFVPPDVGSGDAEKGRHERLDALDELGRRDVHDRVVL